MCVRALAVLAALAMSAPYVAFPQGVPSGAAPRTLAVVAAHADDETPIAPILARYAREGVQVYLILASDGGAGAGQQGHIPRPESTVAGDDLIRQRADEARCAAQALGINPPILLGFPDGKLGDYIGDRTLIYRATQRIAEELARLRPDAVITWGPDGGTGHPDHRIVSAIATQLQRTGAPGVPERVFYMNLPVEGMRAMNPPRPEPPLVVPQARFFTVRVPFASEDLQATARAAACHRSQFTAEVAERVGSAMVRAWNGAIPLIPAFQTSPGTDLFR
jgi:LmbE family N-acetylglucosaminyl deacetylase